MGRPNWLLIGIAVVGVIAVIVAGAMLAGFSPSQNATGNPNIVRQPVGDAPVPPANVPTPDEPPAASGNESGSADEAVTANTPEGASEKLNATANGGTIALTDLDDKPVPTKWDQTADRGDVVSMEFSPNGSRLAAAYMNGEVHLWNVGARGNSDWRFGWVVLPAGKDVVRTIQSYEEANKGTELHNRLHIEDGEGNVLTFLLTERFDPKAGPTGGYVLDVNDETAGTNEEK